MRGVFRIPPLGLRDTVLHVLAQDANLDRLEPQTKQQPLYGIVRRWQVEQPDQFSELVRIMWPSLAQKVA